MPMTKAIVLPIVDDDGGNSGYDRCDSDVDDSVVVVMITLHNTVRIETM